MEKENEYIEQLDEVEDQLEDSDELQENQIEQYTGGTYPETKEQQNLFQWFWRVVNLGKPDKIVRVGNLSMQEIGTATISVRDAINLSNLGHIFRHPTFGSYFATLAKTTSSTSMAKKGWFMDLSISQKKVRERQRQTSSSGQQTWKKIFGKSKQNPEE
jgi:hypothetical protein|tara:strand:- start:3255 stop:3731 length:477 start_codon:yes stop_codon:yes gene_type:complete